MYEPINLRDGRRSTFEDDPDRRKPTMMHEDLNIQASSFKNSGAAAKKRKRVNREGNEKNGTTTF